MSPKNITVDSNDFSGIWILPSTYPLSLSAHYYDPIISPT